MKIELDVKDLRFTCTEDFPKGGMRIDNNANWITVTHIPTMMSATAYGRTQHKAKTLAVDALEYMVVNTREKECNYPEVMELLNDRTK